MVTHSGSHVVGWACFAPAVAELAAGDRELGAHVGVAEHEDGAFLVDAFSYEELEYAVLVLGDGEVGDGAYRRIELGEVAAAGLAVEDGHDLHRGLVSLRDIEVARAAVTDDADVLREVDAVHLGEGAGAADGLEDTHGHGNLHIAFDSASGVLLDEHGEGGDEHGVELAGDALCKSCIVGGNHAELLVLDPLLEGNDVLGHIPNLFDGAATFNLEGVEDVLSLGADGFLVGDVVGNVPHLFPIELLGIDIHAMVEVGLVDVEVHHAGIGATDLGDVGVAETTTYLGGTAPILDLGLSGGITTFDNASDDSAALAGTVEVGYHFAGGTASVELAKPGGDVGLLVVGSQLLLEVDDDDGHVEVAHGGEHVVGGAVGEHLEDDEVNVGSAELVAGYHRLLLGGYHATIDELDGVGEGLLECFILGFELGNELWELGEIGAKGDGEHADAGFGFY